MINYCHCQNLVNYSNDVLKSRNKTNNQENSAACSLALVEQTINRPEDNNNVFKTQIRCLEIMIIIVYITVYLELCNCVILINLLVYMQNNCLLFNLYYIYNFPTFDYAMLFIEKLLVFTLYKCFRCEQKIVVY